MMAAVSILTGEDSRFSNGRPFQNGQPFLTTTDTTVAVVDASRILTFERCPPNVVRCPHHVPCGS